MLGAILVNYLTNSPHTEQGILLGALAVYLIAPLLAWGVERRLHAAPDGYAVSS